MTENRIMIFKHEKLKNFYTAISHCIQTNKSFDYVKSNVTYLLVSDDKKTMIETNADYGPLTNFSIDRKEENNDITDIIKEYIDFNLDRGHWSQQYWDSNDFKGLLVKGDLESVYKLMQEHLE